MRGSSSICMVLGVRPRAGCSSAVLPFAHLGESGPAGAARAAVVLVERWGRGCAALPSVWCRSVSALQALCCW